MQRRGARAAACMLRGMQVDAMRAGCAARHRLRPVGAEPARPAALQPSALQLQRRWASAGPERAREEPKESGILKAFVEVGSRLEAFAASVSNTGLGEIVAPKHKQVHSWGRSANGEEAAADSAAAPTNGSTAAQANGKPAEKQEKKNARVDGVPINETEYAVVAVGEVVDHDEKESGWDLFKKLLMTRKYKTTAQQATESLYMRLPDFSEPEFLEDVEYNLMPAFLDAFWNKDIEKLQSMCSSACYHIDVSSHLKQYEKFSSKCELLMTRRAVMFNRFMFVDDSEYALTKKKKKKSESPDGAAGEDAAEEEAAGDLDFDATVNPEPVFFVSCSAHIISVWVDAKGELKAGDKDIPEDWNFVFGLTPSEGGKWSLSALEFTRAQAMS